MRTLVLAVLCGAAISPSIDAQTATPAYPVPPRPLPDANEIALAVSAGPPSVSAAAAVYAVDRGEVRLLRAGTNGASCMVARDLHPGSAYPICFDPEGTRTELQRELLEVRLRSLGHAEAHVDSVVADAYRRGELEYPERPAVAYMMSKEQVLYSNQTPDGRRVGSWWPHIMIAWPGATSEMFALGGTTGTLPLQVSSEGSVPQFIIPVPQWSDGTPARP